MIDILTALALVLVIEGLTLALMPDRVRALLMQLQQLSPDVLRIGGLAAAAIGAVFVWLLRA